MPEPIKPRQLRKIERIQPNTFVRTLLEINRDHIAFYGGQKSRYDDIYVFNLKKRPLRFLSRLKKPNPQIMVFGPGFGQDIVELNNYLRKGSLIRAKKYPEIDTFGLTRTLSADAQRVVRNDYSQNLAFESIIAEPEKYADLINAWKGKYDLVMAPHSTGEFTDYPERITFFTALTLAQQGEAYVQLYTPSLPERLMALARRENKRMTPERFLQYIQDMFYRLLNSYNAKNNPKLQFTLEVIGDIYSSPYIYIKRVA